MNIALYAVAALFALSAVLNVAAVGKPRKPLTGGAAAGIVVTNAAFITLLVLAAGRLG